MEVFTRFSSRNCIHIAIATLLLFIPTAKIPLAETIYYKDIDGVRYFTNIRPKEPGFKQMKSGWAVNPYKNYRKYFKSNSYYSTRFDSYISYAAQVYNLDPDLIKAIIKVESNFYPGAISPKGAMGLMQLMPETARANGVKRPFDPSENIMGGARYLKKLLNMFGGNLTLALAGYNAGENAVISYGYTVPPYKETQRYVKKVLYHYSNIKDSPQGLSTFLAPKSKNSRKNSETHTSSRKAVTSSQGKFTKEIKRSKVIVESVRYVDVKNTNTKKALNTKAPPRTYPVEKGYTVQVASFSKYHPAKEFEASLKSKTLPAFIKVAKIPGKGTWYRVRVGKFSSRKEALSYAKHLKTYPSISNTFVATD